MVFERCPLNTRHTDYTVVFWWTGWYCWNWKYETDNESNLL